MIRFGLFIFLFSLTANYTLASPSSPMDELPSVGELSESKLLTFFKNKEVVKQGDDLILFAQLGFQPSKHQFLISANLDGISTTITQSSESLWVTKFSAFNEVKDHLFNANIYIVDKSQKSQLDKSIDLVTKEIKKLTKAINQEENLNRRTVLEREKADKQAYLESLEEALENLKVFVKTESFSFSIEQNTENSSFPYLTSISPGVGLNIGGGILTLTGQNFLASPIVKIGGVNATVLNESATSIQVISPTFSILGIKDVEISYPSEQKNTILKQSFTVTDQGILKNLRPVANAQTYVTAIHPVTNPVVLDASTSYDENGDALNYLWVVQTAPNNSGIVPGTTLPNQPNPSVLPGKKGTYIFELKVIENNSEQLESLPIHITLEVTK